MIIGSGRQRELARIESRMDRIDGKIDNIDQVGTRGVAVLNARVDEIVKDLADLKADLHTLSTNIEADMKVVKAGRWQIATAVFFALVPVYAGVVFAIVTH